MLKRLAPHVWWRVFNIFVKRMFCKFFETDLIIKVNVKNERRFDRPTVIFKFKVRSKNKQVLIYNCEMTNEILTKNSKIFT